MEELTKTEKLGVHLGIVALAIVAHDHNRHGERWFNKALTALYRIVIASEIACVITDWRAK